MQLVNIIRKVKKQLRVITGFKKCFSFFFQKSNIGLWIILHYETVRFLVSLSIKPNLNITVPQTTVTIDDKMTVNEDTATPQSFQFGGLNLIQ